MFRYEDTDGIGECFVCKELRTCGQKCKITRDNITEKQVLYVVDKSYKGTDTKHINIYVDKVKTLAI